MTTATAKRCPVSLESFAAAAPRTIVATFDGPDAGDIALTAAPKAFGTGSCGLWAQTKTTVLVGGVAVPCQVGVNMVLLGSKFLRPDQRATVLAALDPVSVKLHLAPATRPQGTALDGELKAPFHTGSYGWNVTGKLACAGGTFQVGINVTAVGSKPTA